MRAPGKLPPGRAFHKHGATTEKATEVVIQQKCSQGQEWGTLAYSGGLQLPSGPAASMTNGQGIMGAGAHKHLVCHRFPVLWGHMIFESRVWGLS